jgi:hypothetical protein
LVHRKSAARINANGDGLHKTFGTIGALDIEQAPVKASQRTTSEDQAICLAIRGRHEALAGGTEDRDIGLHTHSLSVFYASTGTTTDPFDLDPDSDYRLGRYP